MEVEGLNCTTRGKCYKPGQIITIKDALGKIRRFRIVKTDPEFSDICDCLCDYCDFWDNTIKIRECHKYCSCDNRGDHSYVLKEITCGNQDK